MNLWALWVALLVLPVVASGAENLEERKKILEWQKRWDKVFEDGERKRERFSLFAGCKPMNLIVEHLPDEAIQLGLGRDELTYVVKNKLVAANLYRKKLNPMSLLYVKVDARNGAFHVALEFHKWTYDPDIKIGELSPTWEMGWTDAHRGKDLLIVAVAAELTARFIEKFRKVNQEACG